MKITKIFWRRFSTLLGTLAAIGTIVSVPQVQQWLHFGVEPSSAPHSADSFGKPSLSEGTPKRAALLKHSSPVHNRFINEGALEGPQTFNTVAIKGDPLIAQEALTALAVPLKRNVLSSSFMKEGLFDRTLNGDGSAIADLGLPPKIDKIVLIQVGTPQRSKITEMDGASRLRQSIQISVVAAHSGAILKSSRFVVQGVGFNEDSIHTSFNEDLANNIEPLKQLF